MSEIVETNDHSKLEQIGRINEIKAGLAELEYAGLVKCETRWSERNRQWGADAPLSPNVVSRCLLPGSVLTSIKAGQVECARALGVTWKRVSQRHQKATGATVSQSPNDWAKGRL
jgi:hypothetical protein